MPERTFGQKRIEAGLWLLLMVGQSPQPENTRIACNYTQRVGADALELDLRLTQDGQLVLHHDASINRMAGLGDTVPVFIKDLTYPQLQSYNFCHGFKDVSGNRPYQNGNIECAKRDCELPLLEDIMGEYPAFLYNLEIKDGDSLGRVAVDEVYRILTKYDKIDHTLLASFHGEILEYIDQRYPDLTHSTGVGSTTQFVFASWLRLNYFYTPTAAALQIPSGAKLPLLGKIGLDQPLFFKKATQHGMAIHFWTINEKEEIAHLIDAGADAILTDNPEIVWEVLREKGMVE